MLSCLRWRWHRLTINGRKAQLVVVALLQLMFILSHLHANYSLNPIKPSVPKHNSVSFASTNGISFCSLYLTSKTLLYP